MSSRRQLLAPLEEPRSAYPCCAACACTRRAHVSPSKLPLPCLPLPPTNLCRKLAYNRELAASINSGLGKMNEAKADISRMKVGRRRGGRAARAGQDRNAAVAKETLDQRHRGGGLSE